MTNFEMPAHPKQFVSAIDGLLRKRDVWKAGEIVSKMLDSASESLQKCYRKREGFLMRKNLMLWDSVRVKAYLLALTESLNIRSMDEDKRFLEDTREFNMRIVLLVAEFSLCPVATAQHERWAADVVTFGNLEKLKYVVDLASQDITDAERFPRIVALGDRRKAR